MKEIERVIASSIIFSKDGKILMGRKDPEKGGVYSDCWHIPGGGVDEDETLEEAAIREVKEEIGLVVTPDQLTPVAEVGAGAAEKILKETGEKVLCHMQFNRFEVHLDQNAEDIVTALNDDLVEVRWFSREELKEVKQIPGGHEFFARQGYFN